MSTFLLRLVLLCGVWLLALGEVSFGDVLVGVVVSMGLLLLLGYHRSDETISVVGKRIIAFFPFCIAVLRDLTAGTWMVALYVLGLRAATPGYVEVPIGERTTNGVAVTGMLVTLAPGSVLIDVDWERDIMLYHMLDATDPDAVRATIATFYERYQRAVFP